MTIRGTDPAGNIICRWFEPDSRGLMCMVEDVFPAEMLKDYDDGDLVIGWLGGRPA